MSGKTAIFSNLGIDTGITYETILSTLSPCGEYNSAPMGIRSEDGSSLILRPFKATKTCSNLVATGKAVANFTDEPSLFFITALKQEGWNDPKILTKIKGVHVPRLAMANSFLELRVVKVEEISERAVVTCSPVRGAVVNCPTKPYCRGAFAALETVIHATRVRVFLEEGRIGEAESLVQLVHTYRDLVWRVAPNSSYSTVVERVVDLVEQWKKEGPSEDR